MRLAQFCLAIIVTGFITQSLSAQMSVEADDGPPPLPRYREGGTPYDPDQPMRPYMIDLAGLRDDPAAGLIESPPEYAPVRGVLFRYFTSQWPEVVVDCVAALTGDQNHDEIAYVVVSSSYQQTQATNQFIAAGADMNKVVFFIVNGESVWLRDYGPHFIFQDGALAIVDSHYYPGRPLDNFIPTAVGDDHFVVPTYDMGLYYSGGNFQPGPDRSGFVTALVNTDNPSYGGFTPAFIAELYNQYQGIDTLHVMSQLPSSVDGTGHIDMWLYLVDEDSCIISEFKPGSNPTAISITDNAVPYMEDLGFEVHRPPAWNVGYTHYTYTNAFRVNDRIFIPTYGESNPSYLDEDAEALAAWQAAAGPGVEIVAINCYSIIPAAGAIHCIVMQVPRYTGSTPAVHVVSPQGGELLAGGTTQTISWAASDTNNNPLALIELYYSLDDGDTWEYIDSTADTGAYEWNVPDVATHEARIKAVATSADTDQGEGVSAAAFTIAPAQQTVYDFSSGIAVDKFASGYQTISWDSYVAGERTPVTSDISTLQSGAYSKLAISDATGGDTDSHRYVSPTPSSGRESTHIFEFIIDEDAAEIDDIGVLWEGYADNCTQVELYVWDYVAEEWGDGQGLLGQNRFMDNWAGNVDGVLSAHITEDFARYIDASGEMTFLVYAERPADETFHDYMSLTVSTMNLVPGDLDCDGLVNSFDIDPFVLALSDPAGYAAAYPDCYLLNGDCNEDGLVNSFDIDAFVALLTGD